MAEEPNGGVCDFCGGPFLKTVWNRRFCCDECRFAFHNRESPFVRVTRARRERMLDAMLRAAQDPNPS